MEIDLSEYMGAYIDGSRENLDMMDKMLLNLEQNPSNLEAVGEIFRAAHTLKGMSATMGFEKIAHLTHEMENLLDKLRNQQLAVTPQVIDLIFETFDVLRTLVEDSINQTDSVIDLTEISGKLAAMANGAAQQQSAAPAATTTSSNAKVEASSTSNKGLAVDISDFQLTDFETTSLEEAKENGKHIVWLQVTLVADCLLKGPRVFMVMRAIDECQAEVFKSLPDVKDLENEKFEKSFKMLLVSDKSSEDVRGNIDGISEIEKVEAAEINPSAIASNTSSTVAENPSSTGVNIPQQPAAPIQSPATNAPQPEAYTAQTASAYPQQPNYPPQQYAPQAPGYYPQQPGFAPQAPGYYPGQAPVYPQPAPGYPQAPGYVPQAPGYVPQAPSYAPQAPGYVSQAPGYMPQAPGYNAPVPNYPNQIPAYPQPMQPYPNAYAQQPANAPSQAANLTSTPVSITTVPNQPAIAQPIPQASETANQGKNTDTPEEDTDKEKEVIGFTQLITFTMAGETYALEIQQVEAIINLTNITRVPKAPSHIDGVINLRGEIVPVINTRRRLKLAEVEKSPLNQIIILSFEEEKVKAGFLVDSVKEVIRLPETAIEPPTRVSESVDVEYLRGVGKIDSKIVILLNAHRIVFDKPKED